MLILGHKFIPSHNLYHISNIDAIVNTPPNSCLFLDFSEDNLETIEYLIENKLSFCLGVENITQVIYASSLGASYILVNEDLAKTAQNLANNYLFDSKILVNIQKEDKIKDIALLGIDGVLFSNAVIKINS